MNSMTSLLPLYLCFVFCVQLALTCDIHGTNSGICTNEYHPSSYAIDGDELDVQAIQQAKIKWQSDMPYCGKYIANYYSPCVPSRPSTEWASPDANFQFGRLMKGESKTDVASVQTKDNWVRETVTSTIQGKIELEREQGSNHYHFNQNKDCQEAFARYSCWLNFPRCDEFFEDSLPLCQSACENLFRACKFESDLWRCEADVIHGDSEYDIRALFPGQPFKKNAFIPKSNNPLPICTPSIKGDASSIGMRVSFVLSLAVGVDMLVEWM